MCNRLAKAAKTQELASKFAPPDSLSGFSNLIRGGTINIKIVIKKKPVKRKEPNTGNIASGAYIAPTCIMGIRDYMRVRRRYDVIFS